MQKNVSSMVHSQLYPCDVIHFFFLTGVQRLAALADNVGGAMSQDSCFRTHLIYRLTLPYYLPVRIAGYSYPPFWGNPARSSVPAIYSQTVCTVTFPLSTRMTMQKSPSKFVSGATSTLRNFSPPSLSFPVLQTARVCM